MMSFERPSTVMKRLILSFHGLCEKKARAAQIAGAFLADVADEQNVARRLDVRRAHGAHGREQEREIARVVADARRHEPRAVALHAHVGALGENRVEVRRDGEQRRIAAAAPQAHDVALRVALDVLEARLAEHFQISPALRLLAKRRRGNLRQRDEIAHELVVELALERRARRLERRRRHDPLHADILGRGQGRVGGARARVAKQKRRDKRGAKSGQARQAKFHHGDFRSQSGARSS